MGAERSLRWGVVGLLAAVVAAALLLGTRACAEDPDGDGLAGTSAGLADGPVGRDASAAGDPATSDSDARTRTAGRRAKSSAIDAKDVAQPVTGTVRVVVVAAADGTPVAGAEVTLNPGASPRRVATTDARGSAVLPFHAADGGQCDVGVRARGFLAFYRSVAEEAGAETLVEARLERGAVVEVRVVDAGGRPVAGAEVGLCSYTGGLDDWTSADSDGLAVLMVSPGAPYELVVVTAGGFVRQEDLLRSGPIGGPPTDHVVRLERAVRIVGTVNAPEREFVPEASVSLYREGSGTSSESMKCSGTGEFGFGDQFSGRAWVVVASAHGWSDSEPTRAVEVRPGELRADPVLRPPCAVVLRTVDEAGAPLDGEHQSVIHSGGARFGAGGGSEHRVEVQPGRCVVFAKDAGRVPVAIEHELAAGETWNATIRLVPGAPLRGVVVDPEGAPVAGATVRVERALAFPATAIPGTVRVAFDHDGEPSGDVATTTDEEGQFDLEQLPPGRHTVHVSPIAGLEDAVFPDVTAPGEGHRFVVERSSRLRFRVRFEGDPSAANLPSMVEIDGTTTAGTRWSVHQSRRHDGAPLEVSVPRDARPEVTISARGCVPVAVEAPVPRGEVLEIPPVRLVPGVAVRGTLRFPDGRPAPNVTMYATQQRWPNRIVQAQILSNDGEFLLDGLAPGRAVVEAMTSEWPYATFDVEVGSGRPLDLTLPPVGIVWVRVAAPDGGPEPGVAVSALGADGRPLRWAEDKTTDTEGSVTLRLAPGRARIDVGGLVRTDADVRADDFTEVRVTLPR